MLAIGLVLAVVCGVYGQFTGPQVTFENNTGKTIKKITFSYKIGSAIYLDGVNITNNFRSGSTMVCNLPQPINVMNRYNLILEYTDGTEYRTENVLFTANGIIELRSSSSSGSGVQVPADIAGKTLYYKYLYTVDPKTEARSIENESYPFGRDKGGFITFTRNACYVSDENGIKKGSDTNVYDYQGVQNGMHVFRQQYSHPAFLYFSTDYKRMNRQYNNGVIYVFEQTDPPRPQGETGPTGPDRMW